MEKMNVVVIDADTLETMKLEVLEQLETIDKKLNFLINQNPELQMLWKKEQKLE